MMIPAAKQGETAFEVKGTMTPVTVLRLLTNDLDRIARELAVRVTAFPQLFHQAPVVVDPSSTDGELDWPRLVAVLREARLAPIAVTNADPAGTGLGAIALANKLKLVSVPKVETPEPEPEPAPVAVEPEPLPPPPAPGVMLITQPVRSGQVIYARGRDLIVTSSVNPGAQVIADGHIVVHGPLRGRALAGAQGDKGARILTTCLEAELVSVAGEFMAAEDLPRGKPAQIFLDGEKLKIT